MNQSTENEQEIKAGVDLARLRAAVAPVVSAHGVVLVDLEWQTDRAGWVLRITIEREGISHPGGRPGALADDAGGGVTLDDCADVSRAVSEMLDGIDSLDAEHPIIPQHYHLEVSSPGLDRPLRTQAEFARFAGKSAKVKLGRPAPDGQRLLRGTLDRAPEGRVAVLVDGKRVEVPFADIVEAHLVFELTAQPKKKKGVEKQKSLGRPARSS
jgi:ribosome maturation factor RimP